MMKVGSDDGGVVPGNLRNSNEMLNHTDFVINIENLYYIIPPQIVCQDHHYVWLLSPSPGQHRTD